LKLKVIVKGSQSQHEYMCSGVTYNEGFLVDDEIRADLHKSVA